MLQIKSYVVTEIGTNSFLLCDNKTKDMAIVDPGDISEQMLCDIKDFGGEVKYILLTHGHFDHIGKAKQLAEKLGAKIVIGKSEKDFCSDSQLNLSYKVGREEIKPFIPDILLDDGDTVMLGETEITFIHTPGHTIGGGCYIFDNSIITGDTLFSGSIGRTDLPTSDTVSMMKSVQRLKSLTKNYDVYPGHGGFSTLFNEKMTNPYMSMDIYLSE
ncbi:MAG: MBL fold metallo-hydrolase [Acutalibacteraceae bacterium]